MAHSFSAAPGDSAGASRSPVLMLAYLYPPFNYAGALRPARFVKYLRRRGHEVRVLSAGPDLKPGQEDQIHRLRGDMEHYPTLVSEKIARKISHLIGLRLHGWGALWVLRACAYAGRFMSPPPVVISTSPPTATHAVAYWLKRRYGARWIADFRDPFLSDGPRFANALERRLEKRIFQSADAIIANTGPAADLWRRRYPEHTGKLHVVWNGFDPEEILEPLPLPPREHAVLAHTGSVYLTRNPDPLFRALCGLIDRHAIDPRRFRIRFVGPFTEASVPDRSRLERLTRLGCVEIAGAVPANAARRIMASSDYLLLLDMLHGETAGAHVPAKLYDYVRIGRPILACAQSGAAAVQVLARSGIPHVVLTPEDPQAELEQKLLRLLSMPTTPTPMAEEFVSAFTAGRQAAFVSELIQSVASDGPGLPPGRQTGRAPGRAKL